ncbi:hypothetical protein NLJ89_g3115 [Agrocybe chaxingu]|uniref:G-alpha-domain-containing protein n=1 Tax=Agrocybe chaxingu TaxID=84603 RepID=A0A9W8MVT2_9AGAR|nr:hypothetical protein NLJ89_g3115 [Agrocybe chaxingu]
MLRRASSVPSWPPPTAREGETEEERKARTREEAEAKRVSDAIDRQIETDRQQKSKLSGAKILLLGQAESGKSTVLKNFQLHFAPKAFEVEAEVWRPVIHLNLVRSVNFVVNYISTRNQGIRDAPFGHERRASNSGPLTADLRKLCIRLAPLRQVEENLIKILSGRLPPRSLDDPIGRVNQAYNPAKAPEVSIPSGSGWKQALSLKRRSEESQNTRSTAERSEDGQSRRILAALGDDIAALWRDPVVQQTLKAAEIALDEQPGFFLDQVQRITSEDYKPRPEDVLKARVTTIGPEEHQIIAENGPDNARYWTIYDVGGSKTAWAQFFDDVNIIIFLAPMSGFNQVLAEDESVNRLTDSLRLWQMICSNKVLSNIEFVLFLNKLDILDSKLKSGIQFSSFVTSYVNKPNETKPVAKYLLDVFVSIHQQHSPKRRKLHPHLTCAVDTKATASVIHRIQDLILVKLLSQTNIL